MAEDAKVDDGVRTRLRRALKQLRKDREEERAARELLEEMQRNVGEEQERACESERSLCRELEEYVYSWEREIGRPHNLSTKIWQMVQCNITKSDNLESDFTEILEKTHLLVWKETAKTIRVWDEKKEDESPESWSGCCSLPELSDLVVRISLGEVKLQEPSTSISGQRNHGSTRGPDLECSERRIG